MSSWLRAAGALGAERVLVRHGVTSLVATAATLGCTYLFQIAMARTLTTEGYGELTALVAVLGVLTVPLSAVAMAVSRAVAGNGWDDQGTIGALVRRDAIRVSAVALAGAGALLLASPLLATFFHLSSPAPLAVLALLVVLSSALAVFRAAVWGLRRFAALGFNQVLEAFVRLLGGVILVGWGLAQTGALAAYALGFAAALALASRGFVEWPRAAHIVKARDVPAPSWKRTEVRTTNHEGRPVVRSAHFSAPFPRDEPGHAGKDPTAATGIGWAALLISGAFLVMLSADVIVVKHVFPPETAGQYAVLSTLGKVLFLVTNAFDLALFPAAAAAQAAGGAPTRQLRVALGGIAAIVVPILVGYWLLADPLVRLLFGERYAAAAPLLGLYGVAVTTLALAATVAKYALALGRTTLCGPLLILTAVELAAFGAFHRSVEQVVAAMLVVGTVALVGSVLVEAVEGRRRAVAVGSG